MNTSSKEHCLNNSRIFTWEFLILHVCRYTKRGSTWACITVIQKEYPSVLIRAHKPTWQVGDGRETGVHWQKADKRVATFTHLKTSRQTSFSQCWVSMSSSPISCHSLSLSFLSSLCSTLELDLMGNACSTLWRDIHHTSTWMTHDQTLCPRIIVLPFLICLLGWKSCTVLSALQSLQKTIRCQMQSSHLPETSYEDVVP